MSTSSCIVVKKCDLWIVLNAHSFIFSFNNLQIIITIPNHKRLFVQNTVMKREEIRQASGLPSTGRLSVLTTAVRRHQLPLHQFNFRMELEGRLLSHQWRHLVVSTAMSISVGFVRAIATRMISALGI
jgi:hypothetical protein